MLNIGPFKASNNLLKDHLEVDPRVVIQNIAMIKLVNGSNLEIFEYKVKDQNKIQHKNSDIGGHNFTFYVEDVEIAIKYLKSKGVKVLRNVSK